MKKFFLFVLGIVFIFGSFYFFLQNPVEKEALVRIGNTEISLEIVSSPSERQLGLSGRASLPRGKGMLFVFENPDFYGFWMKGMLFPIDIVWINEDLEIVGVLKDISPNTFPQTFYPPSEVSYVLEVPANFTTQENIDTGQRLYFVE